MPKRVEVNKTLRGRMNFKGRLLQKQTNSATKLPKKRCKFTTRKNKRKNWSKNAGFSEPNSIKNRRKSKTKAYLETNPFLTSFFLIPCAAHVPPRCKEVTKCQCECHAGIPAAISASPSKMVAKTAPEFAKTQPGGAQETQKSSAEAP